jgi:hypothetical protein
MHDFLKIYGDTEGPLGFPMKDADAKALDALLKQHPDAEHVRVVVQKATTEFSEGERADVAWIQTEAIDLAKEIVIAAGFRDDLFKANPIVTLNHSYCQPPIGRSIWRKKVKDGDRRGVKAKTIYPSRPQEWTEPDWAPDNAWALVKSGLMAGKSIGFLTTKAHSPSDDEVKKRPDLAGVRRIIDEWVLLEYACCWQPMNPEALVEAVSKSGVPAEALKFIGAEVPVAGVVPFVPLGEYQKALERAVARIDVAGLVLDRTQRASGLV